MSNSTKAYVEHAAIWVKEIHWHIQFFHEVLGMSLREVEGTLDAPSQYWTPGSLRASNRKPGWGIVVLPSELINQRGEVVQKGEHRLMIPRRPA